MPGGVRDVRELGSVLRRFCWFLLPPGTEVKKKKGSGQKQVYLVRLGPKTGTFYNQVKSAPYEPWHRSKAHCTCLWPDEAQVHPTLSTLLEFQLFFCRFLAYQRPSIVPPYASYLPYECRPLHSPHPTPRHASNTRICLHTSAEIHTYQVRHTGANLHHGHRRQCVSDSAASEIEVDSIYSILLVRCRSFVQPPRSRQIRVLLVCRGVGCGEWRVSPYVGIRVWSMRWNYGGSLID